MKLTQKTTKSKRVFVSIREHPKPSSQIPPPHPKPPTQLSRYIRKKPTSTRSQTPEQFSSTPVTIQPTNVPSRRSLSPFIPQHPSSISYIQPKQPECFMADPSIEKEDSQCLPYELDAPKTRHSLSKPVTKTVSKKFDLTPGIFSQKQILSDTGIGKKEGMNNSRLFASSGFLQQDECTTVASRTPSPMLQSRNNKCKALSKNFKISKEIFESQGKSEDLGDWESMLKELEDKGKKRDLSPNQPGIDRPRVAIKLLRNK